jgi:hypothetical protein
MPYVTPTTFGVVSKALPRSLDGNLNRGSATEDKPEAQGTGEMWHIKIQDASGETLRTLSFDS